MIAPFDFALDRELWRWVPPHVSVHITRTPFIGGPVSVDFARSVSDTQALESAALALSIVEPLVVAYACSSGSFVHGARGERQIREAIAINGIGRSVTASGGLIEALGVLGVKSVAVVAPYIQEMTDLLGTFVAEAGFDVASSSTMHLDSKIWNVTYSDVVEMVLAADSAEADAIFISCTNVATYDILGLLERELDKPVLSANQVMMWAALRAAGLPIVDSPVPQRLISHAATQIYGELPQ